jgi:DNA-binding GntR family transcriptional regulator
VQIISLERRPGDPILENQIASAYGVSRTPVREAVLKLADEGLIEIFPQSGTFVARIPLGSLPEAIVIRKALEQTSVKRAAERASRSEIVALSAILERQREAKRFHAAIADASGYPGIWKLVSQVKVHVDRYRRLTLPQRGRIERVIAEHARILATIEAGDSRGAEAAMAAHLDGLAADIPDIRRLNPNYFVEA